ASPTNSPPSRCCASPVSATTGPPPTMPGAGSSRSSVNTWEQEQRLSVAGRLPHPLATHRRGARAASGGGDRQGGPAPDQAANTLGRKPDGADGTPVRGVCLPGLLSRPIQSWPVQKRDAPQLPPQP